MSKDKTVSFLNQGCLFFIVFCFLSLTGCASTSFKKSSDPTQIPALEPAALLKFPDIPIPAAFRLIPEESYTFQNANFRVGLLKYAGKASADQAVVFFKEQMPMYNWRLLNIVEYGRRMLSLEKEQETCVIAIDEKGSRSEIAISVSPKSQIAPIPSHPKSDKPIK